MKCGSYVILIMCMLQNLQAQTLPSQPPAQIQLNFPDNIELKVLVDYVSQRLGVNFYFDEQSLAQKVTLRAPAKISEASLMSLLEGVLQSKGLVIVDADQPGWKRIVPSANLLQAVRAQSTTQPASVITQVFELVTADPSKLEPIIRPFLTQPGGISISVPEQKLLIVTDFASSIQRIGNLVRLLDQPRSKTETLFMPLKNVDSAQASSQLSNLLAARVKSSGENPVSSQVEILSEPRTNQLVLVGTPEAIKNAADWVRSFDVKLPVETKAYQFSSISPQRIDKMARDLLGPNEAKTLYTSTIDAESSTLIVSSTVAIHERIQALKRDLDQPSQRAAQSPVRFYKLQNSTASEVLNTIQAITGEATTTSMSVDGLGPRNPDPRTPPKSPDATAPSLNPLTKPGNNINSTSAIPADAVSSDQGIRPLPQTVRAKDATITADPNTNTIVVVAPPETQNIYSQLIKMLDKRRPQVLVECTVVTLDTSGNFQFGVELSGRGGVDGSQLISFNSFGLSTVSKADSTQSTNVADSLGRLTLNPGIGFNGTILAGDIAEVVIRALKGSSRAKVVSAPKLLVNDNTAATLASVTEAPFTTTSALTGNTSSTSFGGFAQAGTTITITPHISEGEFLQLEYSIALNSFTEEPQSGASTPPPRRTNQLQSKVTIPDGSTIVVGGLNLKSESEGKSAVPFLGDIPVLGYLFSNNTNKQTESTLFVFIRPIILRDDQFADLRFLSSSDIDKAGVPGDYPKSEPLLIR